MSDKEPESNCQEAIVVIGEASESEEENENCASDQSLRSSRSESMTLDTFAENLATISINSKSGFSLNSDRSLIDSTPAKKLILKEDHFNAESNLIADKLIKDNRQLRSSIVNFGTHRYQKTIDDLNQLNQNLIESQERISTTNQYLEKKKTTLNSLNKNLDEIFKAFDAIKLKV